MANTKERVRPVKTLKYLILGVILCAAVGAACFLLGRSASPENTRIDAVVIENQLAQISELGTVSYRYTNMAQFENSSDFYGVTIPFTTKRFILTYDGEIKAGTDLSQASVTVSGSRVTVRLAAAQILSHEIDEDSVEVFDEKTSIFNPFTVEDFSSFQADQKQAMEAKALEKGLLTEASDKAGSTVFSLLRAALPEDWELEVTIS
ncbi:MAG: DUF4230 domain-containing protein [Clostridiales bacterium]|nr:DUF4230 domain-containing protein [Clostridiales bacterium]